MGRHDEVNSRVARVPERQLGTPAQLELLRTLQARNPLLGQCYEGALRALADERNPDALAGNYCSMESVD